MKEKPLIKEEPDIVETITKSLNLDNLINELEGNSNYNENQSPIIENEVKKNDILQEPPHLDDLHSSSRLHGRTPTLKRNLKRIPTVKIEKKIRNLSQLHEFLKTSPTNSKITFNIFEYIKLNFKQLARMPLNEKEELFTKGEKIYDEELDIVHILKKIQEIEKMKMVLFNEDQIALFNLIDKPMVYVNDFDSMSYENCSAQLKMSKMLHSSKTLDNDRIKKIVYNLQRNHDVSPIDKRLMDLIDSNITAFVSNFTSDQA